MEAWAWIQTNWVSIVALLWTIDQVLKIVAQFNPEKDWIDNLSDGFGKILMQFFPKK